MSSKKPIQTTKKIALVRAAVPAPAPAPPPTVKAEPGTSVIDVSGARSLAEITTIIDRHYEQAAAAPAAAPSALAQQAADEVLKNEKRTKDAVMKVAKQWSADREALREGLDPMSSALHLATMKNLLTDDENKHAKMLVGIITDYLMQLLSSRAWIKIRDKKVFFTNPGATGDSVQRTIEQECAARNAIGIDNLIERVQLAVGAMPDEPELAEKRRLLLPRAAFSGKRVKLMDATAGGDDVQLLFDRYDAKKLEIRAAVDSVFALVHAAGRDELLDGDKYAAMKEEANTMFNALYRAETKRLLSDFGRFIDQWESLTETQRRRYNAISAEVASATSV